ncbi:MAG: phosphotransferase family protein [Alphaproteobacteria bacterium]|nr:phosphotransferase family protein [Alphaproteobacteria bacterium]
MSGGFSAADPGTALARFLIGALDARSVTVGRFAKLSGGAIQENWAVDATVNGGPHAGKLALVLRTDAPSGVAVSHGRAHEYAILRAAHGAGVTVPEPLALCEDRSVLGKPFYVMRRVAGTAAGHIVTRDDKWKGDRGALAERLGRELAKLHRIVPPVDSLAFLTMPKPSPAAAAIADYRHWLDGYRDPRPALEWGLAWLAERAPALDGMVLCHRDFRTGNYMVDEHGLTGVLDWEFAGWGDAMEDVGWFCARCWRFGQTAREAGGITDRAAFYRGYEAEGGRRIDPARVAFWEAMAHARWAVIALQQGERHVSGSEPSLDLALTGRRVAELEWELLRMTQPEAA